MKVYLDNDVVSAIAKDDNAAESAALDPFLAAYRDAKVNLVTSTVTFKENRELPGTATTSWFCRSRIGGKLQTDDRFAHVGQHVPHLPILLSLARGNDHILHLGDIVGPRLTLPGTFREIRAHHLDSVERSGDGCADFRHALALTMWEV